MAEQARFTTSFEPENFHAVYDVEEVQRIVEMVRKDLKIEDRFSFLRNYKKCFIGMPHQGSIPLSYFSDLIL
jgi:hypothetical protein